MTITQAQANLTAANETYLSLVRVTRPFSRTAVEELKIDNAWIDLERARANLTYAQNEARNVLR